MQQRELELMGSDGRHIPTYHWTDGRAPRGVIILSHGMGEHARRYQAVLPPLIETGLDVYGLDHRGHGAAAAAARQLGDFGPGGLAAVVGDLVTVTGVAQAHTPTRWAH
jgi:alpha-beta hydrolase superfamily lysophospholipase